MELDIVGEVIEASTTDFTAESKELHSPPAFGSFVKVCYSGSVTPVVPIQQPAQTIEVEDDPFDSFRQASGGFGRSYNEAMYGESAVSTKAALQPAVYAIVCQASTGPVDTSRRLRAFWKDDEQMAEEHPELSEWLLVTHFQAVVIGHSLNGPVQQLLPPQPPKLFSHVRTCSDEEIRQITGKMDFLRTLVNSRTAPAEEVIAACILRSYDAYGSDFDFLVAAGKELASLMKDDYDRLQAIIRRVSP